MLHVENLSKSFGALRVLDGVSLAVRKGEVAALMGPSGCGKTTLLRCLNGLETFDSGKVEIAGIELLPGPPTRESRQRLLAVRRRVGMVFQQFNLFPHRSALGNVIEAPVHVLGVARDAAVTQATALLTRVGLAERVDHFPDMLSGGQQQRVAIARALAMQPEVILFDEPTSALDPRMAAEVEEVMADLASGGQTMVVVSHSLRLVRQAAHTVHVLEAGRIVESGPPAAVLDSPRHPATQRLLMEAVS
jgi:polar amino acid transport system ATP-binding protein